MEKIIEYIVAVIKNILKIFGVELDEEVESNLNSMVNGMKDYEPEV